MSKGTIHRTTLYALATVTLCLAALASRAEGPSGLIGTWVLDVGKSTFDPGPPVKSDKITISDAGGGALHFTGDLVEGDGGAHHFELTGALDGKEVPVTGWADYADAAVLTKRGPDSFHLVLKKAGKAIEWDTFHLSKSGQKMYGRLAGNDNGTRWKYHWVADRQ